MKVRRVVTSFLTYTEGSETFSQGNKLLLLKRSDKVRTYQNHWASVCGGIESNDSSPLERALKEIREETSLSSTDITLIRSGKPLTILTEIIWKVYPFLFHINSPTLINKIQIDWEHQAYKWINPSELINYECVPNLLETLHRVYLPLCVHEGLNDLFKNRTSGAQELSMKALDILKKTVESQECRTISKDTLELWKNLLNIGWHLTQIRPNMKASISYGIINVLKRSKQVLQEGKNGGKMSLEEFESIVIDLIDRSKSTFNESEKKINENFLNLLFPSLGSKQLQGEQETRLPLKIHIITMSYSSTIYSALSSLIQNFINYSSSQSRECYNTSSLTVTIMESRPLNEGATLAKNLSNFLPSSTNTQSHSKSSICIQVITDVSCNYFMSSVTHVLLGADRILGNNGNIINKIGSMSLALSASYFNKPVYILSKSDKIASFFSSEDELSRELEQESKKEEGEKMEENDSTELTNSYGQDWINNIKEKNVLIRNIYFEMVESNFINGYIMEIDDVINVNRIKELWNQRKDSEKIFDEI
ncbi:13413_t:CDS:2 [Funneliformis geosporum]|uniref:5123_t:CDS:1 n=1 Tax=Funneliformis geosporum TaxID=1117311 RepID=A0A9W4SE58_9GLOM|nr:13413_t:CDS:2 [Funneliformis geosporum]CAI2165741.1 5123_t:CDS:2 [Funneliformis geosporum]